MFHKSFLKRNIFKNTNEFDDVVVASNKIGHSNNNLYEIRSSAEHKGRTIGTLASNRLVFFYHHGSQRCQTTAPIVLQNIFLSVQQKKETHAGLQQLEGE